jgi:hypothetical protein
LLAGREKIPRPRTFTLRGAAAAGGRPEEGVDGYAEGELEAAVHTARATVQAAQAAIALLVETAPLACHCSRLRVWNMIADATPDSTYPVCVPTAVGCIRCSLLF